MTPFQCVALLLVAAACDRPTSPTKSDSPGPPRGAQSSIAAVPEVSPNIGLPGNITASPATAIPFDTAVVTFDEEPVGQASTSFDGTVGDWFITNEAGVRALKVDGSKWRSGTPSAALADQAKRLYGDRYAEFLDGVKTFAFFPFAVWKGQPPTGDMRISMRFYPLAGQIDQAAGIAFGIAPNGSYLGVRANALEDNLLFFRVVKGKRTIIDNVRDVPTPSKVWHTLTVELRGARLLATLDGKPRFEKTLDAAPQGRIGLWSKADSQVLFDEFKVEPLGAL